MVTIVQRKASLVCMVNGSVIGHVKAAEWSGGFNMPYNEGRIVVTSLPTGFDMDQTCHIIAGNGTNHVLRFLGFTRSPIFNLDGTVTIQGVSRLAKAYEYENSEDSLHYDGLELHDIIGSDFGTDQQIVRAVLTKAGVSFTPANIGGTNTLFGALQTSEIDVFLWSSGGSPSGFLEDQGKGESALDYIQKYDAVSAVHSGPFAPAGSQFGNSPGPTTQPVGFYRTFETLGGTVYRSVIGGRPRGQASIAQPFEEGKDIRIGSITRGYPKANRFVAVGFDAGDSLGPERFVMQSSNPYMDPSRKITAPPISSPFMEKTAELDIQAGLAMSCERVCYASEPDLNRIIVSGSITTGRDDFVSHGMTITVQGPGGLPNKLGTGELVWVQAVRGRASIEGFEQEFEVLGGGVPDNYPYPPIPS